VQKMDLPSMTLGQLQETLKATGLEVQEVHDSGLKWCVVKAAKPPIQLSDGKWQAGSMWETYEVNMAGPKVREALGLVKTVTIWAWVALVWSYVLSILGMKYLRRTLAIRKGQKQYRDFAARRKGFKAWKQYRESLTRKKGFKA
jgi:hypothetical protein